VAIAHRRLVGLQDRLVTFPSRQPGRPRPRTTRLDVCAFLRRFLPPVLPAGFMQVRHCGLMHATCRSTTDPSRPMRTSHTGATLPLEQPRCPAATPAPVPCPHGGAPRIVLSRVWPLHLAIVDTSEAPDVDTSLTWSMRLWQEPADGTAASSARDNALQGHFGEAAHGAPSPVWGLHIRPTGCHPSPSLPHLASLPPLPLTPYPRDPEAPEAALRGFLEPGIEVTSAGHLNP
jgi:Putative transposase